MFTKLQDNHNAVLITEKEIRFTAPAAGMYQISVLHTKSFQVSLNGHDRSIYNGLSLYSPETNIMLNSTNITYMLEAGAFFTFDGIDYIESFRIHRMDIAGTERCFAAYKQELQLQLPKNAIEEITKKNLNFETIELRF